MADMDLETFQEIYPDPEPIPPTILFKKKFKSVTQTTNFKRKHSNTVQPKGSPMTGGKPQRLVFCLFLLLSLCFIFCN